MSPKMGKLSILLIIAIDFVTKQTCVVHAFFNFPAETDVIEEDGLETGERGKRSLFVENTLLLESHNI